MQKYFNKQKIFDIMLTAIVSALLAFMQSLITNMAGFNGIEASPIVAGGIGAGIRAFKKV